MAAVIPTYVYFVSYAVAPIYQIGDVQIRMNTPLQPEHIDTVRNYILAGLENRENYTAENILITNIYKFE